jgi:dipeptidyl aminopeptidase/acylaminoacyl peptidase
MSRPQIQDPGFDPRLADWLEAAPDRAPAQVLDTVLAAIPSIPQRRQRWLPWRPTPMNRLLLAGAALATAVAVGLGAAFLLPRPASDAGRDPTPSPSVATTPSIGPTHSGAGIADYSTLPGRILVEHLGNALDLSERTEADFNPDRRRFYFMDPADMRAGDSVEEFLPDQPATGKTAADVSFDSRRVVFQDWTDQPSLYEANVDGTNFRRLAIDCDCQLLYPDYDPTATQIVYVRIEGDESWLETYDLATGETTALETTRGPADDSVPEQPAWSPDGASIAFSRLTWNGANDPVVGTVRYGDAPPESGVLQVLDLASGDVRDLPLPEGTLPGDANWSPDGQTLLYTNAPASTVGSVGVPGGAARAIGVDGAGHRTISGWGGPRFLPDGSHIIVQNDVLYLMKPDGTDLRPVNTRASDLSTLAAGYVYIAHWIDEP